MAETLMKYGCIFNSQKPFDYEKIEADLLVGRVKAECCGKYRKMSNLIPKDGKLVCKDGTGCKRKK